MIEKVVATEAALELIATLKKRYGDNIFFFQSGGCCDNSAPNAYLNGELTVGQNDVHLGDIGGCAFWMSKSQYEYWRHTQVIVDAIDSLGGSGNFSLEGPEGKAFISNSRLFTDEEFEQLLAEEKAAAQG